MSKGFTLRTLLPVVNSALADWYAIELVSNKGIKLLCTQIKTLPACVRVTCFRPGKPVRGGVFDPLLLSEQWYEAVERTFHLKMDVQCWHVAPITVANLDSMIARVNAIKKDLEPFKEDSLCPKDTH